MTVKRPPCETAVILAGALLLVASGATGCDVDDPVSRVPPDGGGGGGIDHSFEGEGEGDGGAQTFSTCVEEGSPGNELGVGKYCSPKGDQCQGQEQVTLFCSADFFPNDTSTGCMFECTASEQCGEGATCRPPTDAAEAGGECVPTECLAVVG